MFPDEARRIREIVQADTSFARVPPGALDAAEQRLLASRTIDGFRLEAMRLMALGGNGHSRAIANGAAEVAPLRFAWLGDGPCVMEGPLRGARLTAVNGLPVADVFGSMRPLLAGTDQRARVLAGFMLAWAPAIAHATGRPGRPVYSVLGVDGAPAEIAPETVVPAEEFYPVRDPGVADLLIANGGLATRDEARTGIFLRTMPGTLHYMRIGDLSVAPPAEIAARLDAIAGEIAGSRSLIVDLRGNPGGDFFGAAEFARRLPEVMPGAAIAVLVDKFTFSAALVTAALLKVHAGARLVGEEMGDAPRFHAEGGLEMLPRSGLAIRHSDGWHDWAEGRADPVLTPKPIAREMVAAGSLLPDLPVAVTGGDLVSGRDAALDAARRLVSG